MTGDVGTIEELLAAHPLPAAAGDKDERGCVVLLAGAPSCPGAAVLAANAAFRAGAGRVQVVTDPAITAAIGVAVPETLVLPWAPPSALPDTVTGVLGSADAVCLGPGLDSAAADAAGAVVAASAAGAPVLLDAKALPAALDASATGARVVVAPNVVEAQKLLGREGDDDVAVLARRLAERIGRATVVRGASTVVSDGESCWGLTNPVGLGASGSGDVLAGILVALLARGLPELGALAWAVAIHATAGRHLAGERPNPGYLARDVVAAIPAAVATLTATAGPPGDR